MQLLKLFIIEFIEFILLLLDLLRDHTARERKMRN